MHNRSPEELRKKLEECYQILQIPVDSKYNIVKNSYKKLILEFHPDRQKMNDNTMSEQEIANKFREIQSAFDFIKENLNEDEASENKSTKNKNTKSTSTSFDSFYEQTEIAKDALVSRDAKILVYLPVYVSTIIDLNPFCLVGLKMEELLDLSRFHTLMEQINKRFASSEFQVGVDKNEAMEIVRQHSWYKIPYIMFVGCVEILLPIYHLNPRAGESIARSTPYFSIKEGTQIKFADMTSIYFNFDERVTYTDIVTKFIEQSEKGIVNDNQKMGLYLQEQRFNFFNQTLDTHELLSNALVILTREYQSASQFDFRRVEVFNFVVQLEKIHLADMGVAKKIQSIYDIYTDDIRYRNYDNRIRAIVQALKEYYQKLCPSYVPIPTTENNLITRIEQKQPRADVIKLKTFLENELAAISKRISTDTINIVKSKLLTWMNESTNAHTTTNDDANFKISKLQIVLNWLKAHETLSDQQLENVKKIVHSICAIKRHFALKATSQEHFEDTFKIKTTPLLKKSDFDILKTVDDMYEIFSKIHDKENSKSLALTY